MDNIGALVMVYGLQGPILPNVLVHFRKSGLQDVSARRTGTFFKALYSL